MNLNVVSLDVPFPPNYGGAVDIFYKIKALKQLGVNVHLHCFEYGRREKKELLKYCKEVVYYKRKTGILSNLSLIPYVIYSRRNSHLLKNLNNNSYPILFEGLHTTYYLLKGAFRNRPVLIRSHNIEHDYYRYLAKRETNITKKLFFHKEAFLLKNILNKIPANTRIGAISLSDTTYLKKRFENTFWLPPFHSNDQPDCIAGKGNYAFYHGNLSVSENIIAAIHLIKQFANKKVQLIIAGKDPSHSIIELSRETTNIKIVSNPDDNKMTDLIKNAHVILLPTFQPTGIKLKLIESLNKGRFCIVNQDMIQNTRLEKLCVVTENNFYKETIKLMDTPFSQAEIAIRKKTFEKNYNNMNGARMIAESLMINSETGFCS